MLTVLTSITHPITTTGQWTGPEHNGGPELPTLTRPDPSRHTHTGTPSNGERENSLHGICASKSGGGEGWPLELWDSETDMVAMTTKLLVLMFVDQVHLGSSLNETVHVYDRVYVCVCARVCMYVCVCVWERMVVGVGGSRMDWINTTVACDVNSRLQ